MRYADHITICDLAFLCGLIEEFQVKASSPRAMKISEVRKALRCLRDHAELLLQFLPRPPDPATDENQ